MTPGPVPFGCATALMTPFCPTIPENLDRPACGRPRLPSGLLWFVGRWQVKPDRGAGRVPQIAPLGGQVLDQEQAVSLGRVQVALDHRGARGAVVDDLDQH